MVGFIAASAPRATRASSAASFTRSSSSFRAVSSTSITVAELFREDNACAMAGFQRVGASSIKEMRAC